MIKFLLLVIAAISFNFTVDAATYSTDTNLFENSYTNNLIDMAISQIDNFYLKSYLIFQNGYNYYLVSSDKANVTVSNNRVVFTDSDIIRVIRNQNGYNTTYDYSSLSESSTIVNISSIVVSNIDTTYSVSSQRFSTYAHDQNDIHILTFVLGLVFACFLLTKERSYL